MHILIDMDGVLADFEAGFLRDWRARYPDQPFIPIKDRKAAYVQDEYPREARVQVLDIMHAPGFFRTLPPIPGGAEALAALRTEGHQVHICTTPLVNFKNCVLEKYLWVENHLGPGWTNRLILVRDKTLVQGDILIDDRPAIVGAFDPAWEHVIYDQPYNRTVTDKRRLTWENWRTVLFGADGE